jgi:hypothetical protein
MIFLTASCCGVKIFGDHIDCLRKTAIVHGLQNSLSSNPMTNEHKNFVFQYITKPPTGRKCFYKEFIKVYLIFLHFFLNTICIVVPFPILTATL